MNNILLLTNTISVIPRECITSRANAITSSGRLSNTNMTASSIQNIAIPYRNY